MFYKYQHIEKYGTDEVDGIDLGEVYVFPKIDGTNGNIWLNEDGSIACGSRNRELSLEDDNAGFMAAALADHWLCALVRRCPTWRIFGEWLVPHSLKTYRADAWRKFYVFDVHGGESYIPYEAYQPILDEFQVSYIPPIAIIKNPSYAQLINCVNSNVFLIEDGKGVGEGVVLKNYAFRNKYGRQTWAKIVTSEFKEKHSKEMGAPCFNGPDLIEEKIVEKYCNQTLVEKVFENIKTARGGWENKYIPQLLNTVFYDLVREETWNFVKEYKNPRINFATLNKLCFDKTKTIKADLFTR